MTRDRLAWTARGCGIASLCFLILGAAAHAQKAPAPIAESWDAIYAKGQKIGHTHVQVEQVQDRKGRDLRRIRFETDMSFQRGRDSVRMSLLYGTIETAEGTVLRLDTRTRAAQGEIRASGDVIDGVMKLKFEAGGQAQTLDVPWGPEVRGPYGPELSLSREPLPPGQSREIKTFIPDLNRVCTTRLEAREKEPIPLGNRGETRTLLRVEQTIIDATGKPIPEMASTLWVDDSGQILKSHTDLLGGIDIYRTTKDGALASNGKFDLLGRSIIKTKQAITSSAEARQIRYRVNIPGDDVAAVFPADARQSISADRSGKPGVMDLVVRTLGKDEGPAGPAEVDPQFTRANPLINSEDPRVVEHMRRATARAGDDPWARASAIQEWVFQNMKQKNFSTAFAPASEVARELSGDCTEHSVLNAAMCRAAGIPARCVIGLVYVRELGGFGPHMWNEVYIGGRWVAMDSAFNQTAVDATHIKMGETSLDGAAALEAFLPVLRVFNRLEIEPVEIR